VCGHSYLAGPELGTSTSPQQARSHLSCCAPACVKHSYLRQVRKSQNNSEDSGSRKLANGSPEASGASDARFAFHSFLSCLAVVPTQTEISRVVATHSQTRHSTAGRKQKLTELVFFWIAGQFQQAIVWKQPLWGIANRRSERQGKFRQKHWYEPVELKI